MAHAKHVLLWQEDRAEYNMYRTKPGTKYVGTSGNLPTLGPPLSCSNQDENCEMNLSKDFVISSTDTRLHYRRVQNSQGAETRPPDGSKHLVYVLDSLLTTLTQFYDAIDTWRFSDQIFTPNELDFEATYILERQLCTHSSPTWILEGEVCRLLVLLLESFPFQDFCT